MSDEFNPKTCPVGLNNTKDIEHLGDKLDMAIERLTEKVSDMKEDIVSLSHSMEEKFDKVDKRFDDTDSKIESIRASIPAVIDSEIQRNKEGEVYKIVMWILTGVVGSAIIYVVSRMIGNLVGV